MVFSDKRDLPLQAILWGTGDGWFHSRCRAFDAWTRAPSTHGGAEEFDYHLEKRTEEFDYNKCEIVWTCEFLWKKDLRQVDRDKLSDNKRFTDLTPQKGVVCRDAPVEGDISWRPRGQRWFRLLGQSVWLWTLGTLGCKWWKKMMRTTCHFYLVVVVVVLPLLPPFSLLVILASLPSQSAQTQHWGGSDHLEERWHKGLARGSVSCSNPPPEMYKSTIWSTWYDVVTG